MNEQLSHLSQRLASRNEQYENCVADQERLQSWCKDLASKAELAALGSRLDLQVACCDSSLVDSMQEVREQFGPEIQKLRDDMQRQIDTLRVGLSGAVQDISRLDESLKLSVQASETAYATKAEQNALRESLSRTSSQMRIDLSKSIDAVALEKASHSQLDEAKAVLMSADERLGRDLAQRVSEAADARLDLHKQFDSERDRLRENVAQVQECWRVVAETADDIHQLKLGRNVCIERCDKNEQDLQAVSQLEQKHWDDIQMAIGSQTQQSGQLFELCASLRADLQAYSALSRQEGEKLRQYSTTRYIDQIDKALRLQQTVEQVQKGQVKLEESMRTSFLPKVS